MRKNGRKDFKGLFFLILIFGFLKVVAQYPDNIRKKSKEDNLLQIIVGHYAEDILRGAQQENMNPLIYFIRCENYHYNRVVAHRIADALINDLGIVNEKTINNIEKGVVESRNILHHMIPRGDRVIVLKLLEKVKSLLSPTDYAKWLLSKDMRDYNVLFYLVENSSLYGKEGLKELIAFIKREIVFKEKEK